MKNTMMNNMRISLIFLIALLLMTSCAKPSYCECEEISREAIYKSVGLKSNVNFSKLEACADKVKEDIMLEMPSDQISIDYIQQVSYEMCKHGFYEGKGRENKKYYPESEK